MVMPIAWCLHCLALFCLPLRPRQLRSMLIASETLYAWSTLDVFVVIIAAALLELDAVAKFTIGNECDGINAALQTYHGVGDLLPGEPSCFGVTPTLEAGFWLLACCVVVSTVAGGIATFTAHVALEEHVARARACRASRLTRCARQWRGRCRCAPALAFALRVGVGRAAPPKLGGVGTLAWACSLSLSPQLGLFCRSTSLKYLYAVHGDNVISLTFIGSQRLCVMCVCVFYHFIDRRRPCMSSVYSHVRPGPRASWVACIPPCCKGGDILVE